MGEEYEERTTQSTPQEVLQNKWKTSNRQFSKPGGTLPLFIIYHLFIIVDRRQLWQYMTLSERLFLYELLLSLMKRQLNIIVRSAVFSHIRDNFHWHNFQVLLKNRYYFPTSLLMKKAIFIISIVYIRFFIRPESQNTILSV